jgi:hypothetical protein
MAASYIWQYRKPPTGWGATPEANALSVPSGKASQAASTRSPRNPACTPRGIQIAPSSGSVLDSLRTYVGAVERAFGADVDYGQKLNFTMLTDRIRPLCPSRVTGVERTVIAGSPEQAYISTSMIERQNLTMRMSMRRFTRLTNAFSKKLENLQAAVALHFAHYNLVRLHKTLRVTPAMAANVTDRLWSLEELVDQTSK